MKEAPRDLINWQVWEPTPPPAPRIKTLSPFFIRSARRIAGERKIRREVLLGRKMKGQVRVLYEIGPRTDPSRPVFEKLIQ